MAAKKYQINIVNTVLYKPCLKTGTNRSTHTYNKRFNLLVT